MKIMFSPNICFILYLFLPMSGHSLLYTGVDSQKKKEEKTKILSHYSGSHSSLWYLLLFPGYQNI